MTPLLANWTIVLVGKWNVNILGPDWVGVNILKADNINIEMVLDGVSTFVKYVDNDVSLLPTPDRVILSVTNTKPESLERAEAAAVRLLEALPVTPMAAAGINFTFVETEPTSKLLRAISLQDNAAISDLKYEIIGTQVSRSIKFEDRQLNLNITQDATGAVRVGVNFHFTASSAMHAVEGIRGSFLSLQRKCLDFLKQIYEIEIEGTSNEN